MPTILTFVAPSDAILTGSAKAVTPGRVGSTRLQALIDAMLSMAQGEQGNAARPTMVGLAAPQVGHNERIIIVGVTADGLGSRPKFEAFINLEIISKSLATNENREGCYSTSHICGIVERADVVKMKALDRFGKPTTQTFKGFPARIVQHEIDHLDGIRFPDRISDDDKLLWVEPADFGAFREQWPHWSTKCSRATWDALKAGSPIK